jgi:carbamoyl-phosphate synthase large subunit
MNLLFLNVGRRCELVAAFGRALVQASPGLVWGSDPNPEAPALAQVDRVAALPAAIDTPEFLRALADFLVREHIDLIIPTIDPDLLRLDAWRDELRRLAPATRLLLSPSRAIQIARDKRKSRAAFAELGAEVPKEVDPGARNIAFPIFVKPAAGSASQGARRIESAAQLQEALRSTADPMFEELVTGPEVTVDVLMDFAGMALKAVPRRRIQVRGGEMTRGVIARDAALEGLALRLAHGLGCTGPVTLQFRNPTPDRWIAMELNARMGGGLPLTVAAGGDWPRWVLELCVGRTPDLSRPLLDGLRMSRFDSSVFIPPLEALPSLWAAVRPLPRLLILDLDDTLYPEADFVGSGHRAAALAVWRDHRIDIEPELRRRFAAGQRGDTLTAALQTLNVPFSPGYVERVLVPAYREHTPQISPHVDARPVLTELRARGHVLALLSDGWAAVQRGKLAALGLADLFAAVMFTDELGRDAWKPSTRGFEALLQQLGIEAQDAVYIADNPAKDFLGPHRLGMQSIRIMRPGGEHAAALARPRADDASWRVTSLAELLTNRP